MAQTI